jgi:hypothetical protein
MTTAVKAHYTVNDPIGCPHFLTANDDHCIQHQERHITRRSSSLFTMDNHATQNSPTPPALITSEDANSSTVVAGPSYKTYIGIKGKPLLTPSERKRKSRQDPELYGMSACLLFEVLLTV